MIINYKASVKTQAGWRDVRITAKADQVSAGMARVTQVTLINGEEPTGTMSRTGARRQQFWAVGIAQREVGARKRLSACVVEA